MSSSRPSLTAAIRSLEKERIQRAPDHPDPELLLAYHARSLGDEEREELQEHLVSCSVCSRAILDMGRFPDIETTSLGEPISDEDVRRELRRLRGRITKDSVARDIAPTRPVRAPRGPRRRSWPLRPIAAMLAIACIGLVFRVFVLEQRIDSMRQPSGERSEAHLEATSGQRADRPETVVTAPRSNPLVIYLEGYDLERFDSYEARILSADGTQSHPPIPVSAVPGGTFAIWFPVPPTEGSYRIVLDGFRGDEGQPLRTYRFRIVHASRAPGA